MHMRAESGLTTAPIASENAAACREDATRWLAENVLGIDAQHRDRPATSRAGRRRKGADMSYLKIDRVVKSFQSGSRVNVVLDMNLKMRLWVELFQENISLQ